jgi:hypothetical protein
MNVSMLSSVTFTSDTDYFYSSNNYSNTGGIYTVPSSGTSGSTIGSTILLLKNSNIKATIENIPIHITGNRGLLQGSGTIMTFSQI